MFGAIFAAGAAAFAILYLEITMKGRRRKREAIDHDAPYIDLDAPYKFIMIRDIIYAGTFRQNVKPIVNYSIYF